MIKNKKSTIYHDIYIKVFYDRTLSYIKVSTDHYINTIEKDTSVTELIRVFEEDFDIRVQ